MSASAGLLNAGRFRRHSRSTEARGTPTAGPSDLFRRAKHRRHEDSAPELILALRAARQRQKVEDCYDLRALAAAMHE